MQDLVDRIIDSKPFGRSLTYANLLRYLVACSERGEAPKEISIAADILGKPDFDSTQSSLVRVHVYKLRKRLDRYYAGEGRDEPVRLRIPKGSYAIEYEDRREAPAKDPPSVAPPPSPAPAAPQKSSLGNGWKFGLPGIILGFLLAAFFRTTDPAPPPAFWADFLTGPRPKQVVIGDLLVYRDSVNAPALTYRHYRINSDRELDAYRRATGQEDLRVVSYGLLVRNSTVWVKWLTELFTRHGADFDIGAMTRFNPREIGSHDLIIAGLLKTHGLFRTYFPDARLQLADTDALILTRPDGTRHTYATSGNPDNRHVDYGLIRRARGPNGNTLVQAGGLWDTASSQMIKNLTEPDLLRELEITVRDSLGELPPAFEILYRVEGIDRMELQMEVVYVGRLD